jgi:hypothetical protein
MSFAVGHEPVRDPKARGAQAFDRALSVEIEDFRIGD